MRQNNLIRMGNNSFPMHVYDGAKEDSPDDFSFHPKQFNTEIPMKISTFFMLSKEFIYQLNHFKTG